MRIFQCFWIIILTIIFTTCYKESVIPLSDHDFLEFYMEDEQLNYILDSRGEKFEIDNPKPSLTYHDEIYDVHSFKLRGQSALNYRRKSYNVVLIQPLPRTNQRNMLINDFRLLALTADYTYIENYISYNFFRKLGMMPLFFQYIEVIINEETHGLYIFIENPEYHVLHKMENDFILRRGYQGTIDNYKYSTSAKYPVENYIDRFADIYEYILLYSGKELYDSLRRIFNVDHYLIKIAYDYLIKNGDYTDEIYFYTTSKDSIFFDVMPWDYDDIFADQPHEIGNDWGVGKAFGERIYTSQEDIINDVGEILMYSIEDDLDYKMARDPFIYNKYLTALRTLTDIITEAYIDSVFTITDTELNLFLSDNEIIEQSYYDKDPFNLNNYRSNINAKKQLIIEYRNQILNDLNTEK